MLTILHLINVVNIVTPNFIKINKEVSVDFNQLIYSIIGNNHDAFSPECLLLSLISAKRVPCLSFIRTRPLGYLVS